MHALGLLEPNFCKLYILMLKVNTVCFIRVNSSYFCYGNVKVCSKTLLNHFATVLARNKMMAENVL